MSACCTRHRVWSAMLLLLLAVPVQADVADLIKQHLTSSPASSSLPVLDRDLYSPASLQRLYRARGFQPAWVNRYSVNRHARFLLDTLERAMEHGLSPYDYHLAALRRGLMLLPVSNHGKLLAAELELLFSDAALSYARHLFYGRIDPDGPDGVTLRRYSPDALVHDLNMALLQGGLPRFLEALAPPDPRYAALQSRLAAQWQSFRQADWAYLGEGPSLRPGMRDERVPALARRLGMAAYDQRYDESMVAMVRKLQQRWGLQADGVVGEKTRAVLNRDPADIIETLIANLERWRWVPRDLEQRRIEVNIADFSLQALDRGQAMLGMKVIVGRDDRATPLFSGEITYVVLNPYWNVPRKIALRDLLPRFQRNPALVDALGFEIWSTLGDKPLRMPPETLDWNTLNAEFFPYRLRQKFGDDNALGQVKFMFPNRYAVYLHDTPETQLFERDVRAFSSGCVRVEKPRALLHWLSQGEVAWPERGSAGNQQRLLRSAVPVHLQYWTAWVDAQGELQLRPDIYAWDLRIVQALNRRQKAVL